MANNNLNVNVKVTGLEQLQTLQSRIQGVSDKFSNLQSAIAGFALVNVVKNILNFADAVSDLSAATGVAIEDILGFQKAVTAFGGSAEIADKGLLKLTQTLGEARSGNDQAKEAFMKLGFTLNDIATLEGKGLLTKVLEGLGNIPDKAQQAALKAQVLTKEFRTVAVEGDNVANSFKKLSADSVSSAAAIQNVGDANDKLQKVFGDLKIAIANVVNDSGLADWLKNISVNSQELEKYVKLVGAAFLLYFGGQTIVNLIKIAESIMAVAKAVAALEIASMAAGGKVGMLVGLLAKIGLATALITQSSDLNFGEDEAIKKLRQVQDAFAKLSDEQRAVYFALNAEQQAQVTKLIQLGKTAADAMKAVGANMPSAGGGKPATGDSGPKPPKSPATLNLIKSIEETSSAYKRLNEQRLASIRVQESVVGKTADEAEMMKTLAEISGKAKEEISKLEEKKKGLSQLQLAEEVGAVIDNQIKKIQEQEQADLKATQTAVQGLQTKKMLEEDRLRTLENINKAIEDQERRSQALGDVLRSANDKLIEVNFESSITGLSEVEKQIARINESNRRQAAEAGRAFAAQFEGMDLTAEQSKELANGLDQIAKRYKQITDVQVRAASQSRTFASGWKNALNEYVDNATNAAKRAESIFKKAFGGMEDLIVNFAKTGKFEWKNFVAMMLEELLRSQIQMIFAQMMGGMQQSMGGLFGGGGGGGGGGGQQESGGGIMDAIGSIFGMGGGGQKGASANNPMYVVDVGAGGGLGARGMGQQDQGGGLFDSIANLFGGGPEQLAGPGTPEGGGGFFDSLTSGISDFFGGFSGPEQLGGPEDSGGGLFDSLGGLFDGWFANGGNIGAGKFGVVGEAGPELVSGPATVTPMGGGSNVTFNINAVDAQSFKSMIAADPGFLYGVAMQGAKGIPMRG
jgi:lambda family phage tail tape measure protein